MNRTKLFFTALSAALLFTTAALSAQSATITPQKKITATVEIVPNYMWHMFASSNLWDKPENPYGDKYGYTIPDADRQFLYDNRELIAWGNGRLGTVTVDMFFAPLLTKTTFEKYIASLEGSLKSIPESTRSELIRIMRDNYAAFKKEIWPLLKPELLKAKEMIDARFAGTDPIALWEENLGKSYPGEKKELVLTFANAVNLPSANNISMERNNFGIVPDEGMVESVFQTVRHEIGIFIIMPVIEKLMSDPSLKTDFLQSGNVVYVAFETFAEKRKDDIFGGERRVFLHQWEEEYRWFYDYYLSHDFAGADPETLLRDAIAAFVADSQGRQ